MGLRRQNGAYSQNQFEFAAYTKLHPVYLYENNHGDKKGAFALYAIPNKSDLQ